MKVTRLSTNGDRNGDGWQPAVRDRIPCGIDTAAYTRGSEIILRTGELVLDRESWEDANL